jgi:betaine-aldehyde dehydrogenase
VRRRADELAELESRNTGKPIVEAEFDIAVHVATCFEYYGVSPQNSRRCHSRSR